MEYSHRIQPCCSVPDKEPQNIQVEEIKQPVESFPTTTNLETEREQLVENTRQSDKKEEYDTSKKNPFIQPQVHQAKEQSCSANGQGVCVHQIQQEFNNSNMELQFPGPNPGNTFGTKLASILPSTQYTGYFQSFGNPLKFATPFVQGAMQSAVSHAKGLLQTSEVKGSHKKLPVTQPLCTQPSSTGQMQLSLSTVAASYNIRGQVAIPWYPPCVTGDPRLTTPFSFPQTQGEQSCLAITASPATPFSNISTPLSMDTSLRQSELHALYYNTTTPDSQAGIMQNTIDFSPGSVTGNVPRATTALDMQYRTATLPDSQPRVLHNSIAPSLTSETHTTGSGHLGLSSSTTTVTRVNENVRVTATETDSGRDLSVTHVPDFQPGRVDAKKFPPRYYDLRSLEIGTWKYQRQNTRVVSRLKVIFSQRKFVYEFQLNSSEGAAQDNQQTSSDDKQIAMTCIEIPFRTVVGINVSRTLPAEVVIEVDTVPVMWLGRRIAQQRTSGIASKYQYNTLRAVDLTNGQLSKTPYHKLSISSPTIDTQLMRFDVKFCALLRIPVEIDPNKSPPEPISVLQRGAQSTKRKRTESEHQQCSSKCSCTAGCATKRCACIRDGRKCQECRCVAPCKNPLNILEEFGVNLEEAKKDSCLMQKLPKIYDLRTLLRERSVLTPCCDSRIPLKTCCAGIVECPDCESEYRYSWCTGDLCDEEHRPRNHCEICQICRDYRDQHCSHCNRCYFSGSLYGLSCPCRNDNQRYLNKFL